MGIGRQSCGRGYVQRISRAKCQTSSTRNVINETLMQQYVNGIKRPTLERRIEIEEYIHQLATRLNAIKLQ